MFVVKKQSKNMMNEVKNDFKQAIASAWHLFFLVAIALWPKDTFAADTFGTLICNIQSNGMTGYAYILNVAAYCIGTVLLLRGMLLFKKHTDAPSQTNLATPIAHCLAAGALSMLPIFVETMVWSIFKSGTSGDSFACNPGAVTAVSAGQGLDVMMKNFIKNIHEPVFVLISLIGFIVGVTFMIQALLRMAKSGSDPRAADPKIIISNLVFGSLLIAIATTLPSMLATIFGNGTISDMSKTTSIIQWSEITGSSGSNTTADEAVRAVLAFVQILGGIAFLRGWLLLKKAVEGGQATIPQGLTFIIAGAMCVNIDKMLSVIDETFGTGLVG